MYELVDSIKTYSVAVMSLLVGIAQTISDVVEFLTIILTLILVIARLINDVPKAIESVRKYRKRKQKEL